MLRHIITHTLAIIDITLLRGPQYTAADAGHTIAAASQPDVIIRC